MSLFPCSVHSLQSGSLSHSVLCHSQCHLSSGTLQGTWQSLDGQFLWHAVMLNHFPNSQWRVSDSPQRYMENRPQEVSQLWGSLQITWSGSRNPTYTKQCVGEGGCGWTAKSQKKQTIFDPPILTVGRIRRRCACLSPVVSPTVSTWRLVRKAHSWAPPQTY